MQLRFLAYIFALVLAVLIIDTGSRLGVDHHFVAMLDLVLCIAFLLALFTALGLVFKITGYKRYLNFIQSRDKGIFTWFIDDGIFLKDKHFWILLSIMELATYPELEQSNNLPIDMAFCMCLLSASAYLLYSIYLNLLRLDPAMPPVLQTRNAQSVKRVPMPRLRLISYIFGVAIGLLAFDIGIVIEFSDYFVTIAAMAIIVTCFSVLFIILGLVFKTIGCKRYLHLVKSREALNKSTTF